MNKTIMEENIYKQILTDSNLQAKLMLATNKSYSTIRRWAITQDEMLTTITALGVIKEHLASLKQMEVQPKI